MKLLRKGRVWKFGDQINTDLILPSQAMRLPESEMHTLAFEAIRPGWVKSVQPGDILVCGAAFGLGSSRPIGAVLRACGIAGVLAESINGLAYRNCINASLPAMACPGVGGLLEDGEIVEIDFIEALVRNTRSGQTLRGAALPPPLAEIINAGGIMRMLIAGGHVESKGFVLATR